FPFITVLPRVTCPSPPMATAPLRRTANIVVPCGLNVSDMERLTFADLTTCVLPEGGKRRRCGPGGRNQGACRPGWWRCRHGRATPGRHANPYSIQEDGSRTNVGRGADTRAPEGRRGAPIERCE